MSTVTIARDAARQIQAQEWGPSDDGDRHRQQRQVYIGSALSLDPCGRYHHMLSPNSQPTKRCEDFWESLERQLERRGLSLTSGEGDALDQYAVEMRDVEVETTD
jgi:hypothetical protein